jgi:hypothetical protein
VRRLLLCLPLCLALAAGGPPPAARPAPAPAADKPAADDGAPLPDAAGLVRLARTDPVAFVEACLRRCGREVKGYRCTLQKQERLGGKLQRSEVMDVAFRENPFSVLLDWQEGARLAQRVLYVRGENGDQLLVRPAGWRGKLVSVVTRDPEGPEARESGRYPVPEFGIKVGTERTLAAWKAARKAGALHVEYLGEKKVPEAGDCVCYVLRRTGYARPEEGGVTEATLYYDKETWLQVGSVLKGEEGKLVGEYFFRDVRLNPAFDAEAFTRAALTRD